MWYWVLYYFDGRKFEGTFKDGEKNGEGIFYLKDGNKYRGFWENDRRILDNYIENKEYIQEIKFLSNPKLKLNILMEIYMKVNKTHLLKLSKVLELIFLTLMKFIKGNLRIMFLMEKENYFAMEIKSQEVLKKEN